MNTLPKFLIFTAICTAITLASTIQSQTRRFSIDYENDAFKKDGEYFRYVSGSVHYFRIPPIYWRDRLLKTRAAGLNAIEFYIPWNYHELQPGRFDFTSPSKNVAAFIRMAHELGLVVLLRVGPYVCGEWENGGLPWWLIKGKQNSDIKMRSFDKRFLAPVHRWYNALFPVLEPLLYKNGGPVVMIQVENEYGSFYACDVRYTTHLRDFIRTFVGVETPLYTTDGGSLGFLKCGYIPDVYPTVDFGANGEKGGFAAQRVYAPRGPLVNSEFYPGWLDVWAKNHSTVDTHDILPTIDKMWAMNASFSFYMFHGGTNFGFWNGAERENPCTTSYDYDAPISEAGDLTDKYWKIRDKLRSLVSWKVPLPPGNITKIDYGNVTMRCVGTLFDHLDKLSPPTERVTATTPMDFEDLEHPYGFVLYETELECCDNLDVQQSLRALNLRDRAFVFVNGKAIGTLVRQLGSYRKVDINLPSRLTAGSKLQILVENEGRQTYETINDHKGLGNVSLNGRPLENWKMYKIHLENLFSYPNIVYSREHYESCNVPNKSSYPMIYTGQFIAKTIADTFMNPDNWGRGHYFINSFHIGRYWPSIGPQVTLYTPKSFLRRKNHAVLIEFEKAHCTDGGECSVAFQDVPYLDKPVAEPHDV